MATLHVDKERQVVPRWRTFANSVILGEHHPFIAGKGNSFGLNTIQDLLESWKIRRELGVAGDLVSVCVTLGLESEARDAANYILNHHAPCVLTSDLARSVVATSDTNVTVQETLRASQLWSEIASIKRQLQFHPHDPLRWVEVARLYVIIGHNAKAEMAMRIAIALAPQDRFVLRAAARMWLHLGDYDRAYGIVKSSPQVRIDPWIMSAEIALSSAAGTMTASAAHARRILEQKRIAPFHLSELASALGTMEIFSGNAKKGKKLIRSSLEAPCENALAQAAWLSQGAVGSQVQLANTQSHEANAWVARQDGEWSRVVDNSRLWQMEQPFSGRPAMLGSFAATLTGEYELGADMAQIGLRANPNDFILKNNRAFALARLGKGDEASALMSGVREGELSLEERIVYRATLGMIAFRRSNPELGRRCYLEATFAAMMNDPKKAAVAAIYRAEEELRISASEADQAAQNAVELAKRHPDDLYIKQLLRGLRTSLMVYRPSSALIALLASEPKPGALVTQ